MDEVATGAVIAGAGVDFPPPEPDRICSNCEHAYFGSAGVFCHLFQEDIWNEAEALDCEAWEPIHYKPRIRTQEKQNEASN